jgi:hypothetical protein
MNPLTENQIERLYRRADGDLARKVTEIIDWINDQSDTVLGEEIDNGTTTEYVDNFEKGSFSQPLTEGEEKCGLTERECRLLGGNCYDEPQESNKEEEFDTEWMKGKSLSELSKEPSKKPSERIEEIFDIDTESKDELHNQGKIVGCGECGNNIIIKNEENTTIRIIDLIIERLSGGDTIPEYKKGYIDALVYIRESILQRIK